MFSLFNFISLKSATCSDSGEVFKIIIIHLCPVVHLISRTLNFDKKQSVLLSLNVNHLIVLTLFFRVGLGLQLCLLRRPVRRTLYDLYCLHFLSEVMVKFVRKARGHFITLSKSGMHFWT